MKQEGYPLAFIFLLTVLITAVIGELETCAPLVTCKDEKIQSFHKTFLEIGGSPNKSRTSANAFVLHMTLLHNTEASGYTEYQGECI